jgi:hypothetical protein
MCARVADHKIGVDVRLYDGKKYNLGKGVDRATSGCVLRPAHCPAVQKPQATRQPPLWLHQHAPRSPLLLLAFMTPHTPQSRQSSRSSACRCCTGGAAGVAAGAGAAPTKVHSSSWTPPQLLQSGPPNAAYSTRMMVAPRPQVQVGWCLHPAVPGSPPNAQGHRPRRRVSVPDASPPPTWLAAAAGGQHVLVHYIHTLRASQ